MGGSTPSKQDPTFWENGDIPWVSPKDMKTFEIRGSEDKVTQKALARLSLVPEGSVLVVVRSGILSHSLPVAQNHLPVTINQDMRAFVPAKGIDSRYLALQLTANSRAILNTCAKDGTTVASIEGGALASFPLVIAPHTEQTRIVEKLEELLGDLDAGVAELKAAQKKLTQYRQSLLKAAVEGALTADWRAQNPLRETGADLLARILQERRARWEAQQLARFEAQGKTPPKNWQARYPEPVAPDTTELPALPRGWVWTTIDQLADVGTGVTPLKSNRRYYDAGSTAWITSGALNESFVDSASQFVTDLALAECRLTLYPAGTLLVAMYGEGQTRGKCSELRIEATINQAIAAIVMQGVSEPCRPFVKSFLLKSYKEMRKQASGGVQPNLNLQIIKSLALPLPSLSEQMQIATVLSTELAHAESQSGNIDWALKQSAAQRQNLLKAAFSGQLVPQNPTDEPASTLLARIRAERAAQVVANKARGRRKKVSS